MAQLFEDERRFPDNAARQNLVFMGYPFTPPLPADDYRAVVAELQEELPVRFWYFLDEITTAEMMRKIWRAMLRADVAIFDVSGGNPNVAFELGLAVGDNKKCMTILKTGEPNPLGSADLGYAERAEYTSAATLKDKLREIVTSQLSGLRLLSELSYGLLPTAGDMSREEVEQRLREVLLKVFENRQIQKRQAIAILGEGLATAALNALREKDVLRVEGQRRGARWVFTDNWVYGDHEVSGVI
jgi:nucleoside 2-deoxyribosyltransferase